jgi:hypothetical protein
MLHFGRPSSFTKSHPQDADNEDLQRPTRHFPSKLSPIPKANYPPYPAGLAATFEQRLRWLEEAIAFAHATGALPRPRPNNEGWRND